MNSFSNELSPAQVERLALLMEECGEVIQVCAKVMRHGYGSGHSDSLTTNAFHFPYRADLAKVIGQLHFATDLMIQNNDVYPEEVGFSHETKAKKVWQYLYHEHKYNGGVLR